MSTKVVNTLGGILILLGFAGWAVTGGVAWLLMSLCGVGLIVEDWIKGGKR